MITLKHLNFFENFWYYNLFLKLLLTLSTKILLSFSELISHKSPFQPGRHLKCTPWLLYQHQQLKH